MDIRDQLNEVFREIFNDSSIQITPETTANDIEGWDSFSHMTLIVAIEARFCIVFSMKEVMAFRNVGDLMKNIEQKMTV